MQKNLKDIVVNKKQQLLLSTHPSTLHTRCYYCVQTHTGCCRHNTESILFSPGSAGSPFVSGRHDSVCSSTPSAPPAPRGSGSLRTASPRPGPGSDTGWRTHWSGSIHLDTGFGQNKNTPLHEALWGDPVPSPPSQDGSNSSIMYSTSIRIWGLLHSTIT